MFAVSLFVLAIKIVLVILAIDICFIVLVCLSRFYFLKIHPLIQKKRKEKHLVNDTQNSEIEMENKLI